MSSIVNKSGVRFQPKVKQRRSLSNAQPQSRKSSVAPADLVTVEKPVIPEQPIDDDEEHEEEEDEQVHSSDGDVDPMSKPQSLRASLTDFLPPTPLNTQRRDSAVGSVATSRRGSVVESTPPATKQRRLSTLSNTTRPEGFRRTSVSGSTLLPPMENRSHVISIPQPQPASKRRRSSVAASKSVLFKKRSTSGAESVSVSGSATPQPVSLMSPPATQIPVEQSHPQPLPVPQPQPVMTRAEAKSQEDPSIGQPIIEEEEHVVKKINEANDPVEDEGLSSMEPSTSSMKVEGLIFDELQQRLRKVTYDSNDLDMEKIVIKDIRTISKYSQLSKSLHSLDPEKLAKITIDDESFTMEDLCKPTLPIGRISSQFQRAQEARKNRMDARKKRKDLRKQAKVERRSIESLTEEIPEEKKIKPEDLLDEEHINEPSQHAAIQLKLGTDGTLVVDEESRIVDRHRNMDNIVRERHDENPFENIVNSATYGKQRYTDKWDNDEVSKFYQALGAWGTDFALIAQMFPYRTRRQIKSKFILEEKKRPRLIELALSNKLKTQFDFDAYCNDANKTFSTLDEFNVKLEQLKQDHEQNLKELSLAKEKAKEEDVQRQKKREHEIQTGQRTMTRQERITELTKHETVLGSIDDVKKQRQGDAGSAAA